MEEHSNEMEDDLATSGKMIAFLTGTHRRSLFKSWRWRELCAVHYAF
ncbi:hypothetical protein VCRA2121O157_130137 [Vibrio crassostreae]|nr:hypothetical protein VCRA2113O138_120015 [Vibrio crassostreae]CAK1742951.1 hypothetical protein VCRA2113O140_130015 [Vibrio crassostreae]CAK1780858.1 hypothetical protein VCRA2113O137_150015 [Vibrio crassostreae]CAK2251394.1 hypothetical protein VCRA2116O141_130015 [Vibrio crassostreae]CAK2600328.1 hypothetical protein VCRA2113O23_120027 [Vibrio crassostreae]